MSVQKRAKTGDSLCGIAIDAGFLDCTALRAEPANSAFLTRDLKDGDIVTVPELRKKDVDKPVDVKHQFVKKNSPPVAVRFVHGSPDKKFLDDTTLKVLNVSNFETDKGGVDGTKAFPSGFGFDPDGHADVDTFKVEVHDPAAGGTVKVKLEALKPVKQPDGTIQFQPITGVPDAANRKIDALDCNQCVSGSVAFRSRYMRLVVNQPDFVAASGQTLLTAEAVDAGDEALEILDQRVRATYEFARCPASPKCRVTAELDIGQDEKRAKFSVHILQDPATGTPLATIDQARKSVFKYVRELYAQASMAAQLIGSIRNVPAPTNLIAIANANGAKAVGGGTIQVHVQIGKPNSATFDFDQQVQIVTKKGASPLATATALAKAINAAFAAATPPFAAKATPSDNPPLQGQAIGSADVLVGDPLTQSISLSVTTSGDVSHPASIGRITSTNIPDFTNVDSHVGTIEERTLVKNYDTGTGQIDLFIIGTFGSGALGEAFIPNAAKAAALHTKPLMVNSALVFAATVTKKDNFHSVIPHEFGHILMDDNHALLNTEMMFPFVQPTRIVSGPQRISDPIPPRTIGYDSGFKGNPVTMLRTHNKGLIGPW